MRGSARESSLRSRSASRYSPDRSAASVAMFALISLRVPAGHVALAVGSLGRRDRYGARQVPSWVHQDGSARSADGLMVNVWRGAALSTAGLRTVASAAGSRRRSRVWRTITRRDRSIRRDNL